MAAASLAISIPTEQVYTEQVYTTISWAPPPLSFSVESVKNYRSLLQTVDGYARTIMPQIKSTLKSCAIKRVHLQGQITLMQQSHETGSDPDLNHLETLKKISTEIISQQRAALQKIAEVQQLFSKATLYLDEIIQRKTVESNRLLKDKTQKEQIAFNQESYQILDSWARLRDHTIAIKSCNKAFQQEYRATVSLRQTLSSLTHTKKEVALKIIECSEEQSVSDEWDYLSCAKESSTLSEPPTPETMRAGAASRDQSLWNWMRSFTTE